MISVSFVLVRIGNKAYGLPLTCYKRNRARDVTYISTLFYIEDTDLVDVSWVIEVRVIRSVIEYPSSGGLVQDLMSLSRRN